MNRFPCAASGSQGREWTARAIDKVGDTALGAGRVTAAFTSRYPPGGRHDEQG